jgi:uncharacterized membrane protein YkoI
MSGRKIQVLVALVIAGATVAVAAPAGAQAASSHPAMAKKTASTAQHTMKVKESTPGLAAQATVSADSAQKIALAQVSHGWVRTAELEEQNGTLVYSYDIKARGKSGVEEVLVDAKTGAVVSTTHETAKAEAMVAAAEKKSMKPAKPASAKPAKSTAAPKPATGGASTTKPATKP